MTEGTEGNGESKREIDYHAPVREFDNKTHLVTNIGFTAKSDEKYQVIWLIPKTDEECQKRYDSPLSALVEAGVRQLSTRPDYKSVGFYTEDDKDSAGIKIKKSDPLYGELKPEGHEAMQTLADGYEMGKRSAAGPNQKIMAKKAKDAESELGMTMEQMVAKMKALKEQGLLDESEA